MPETELNDSSNDRKKINTPSVQKQHEEMYQYSSDFDIILQMKSWMAINPTFGCIWDCAYCIQHKDRFFDTSKYRKVHKIKDDAGKEFTAEDIVAEIMAHSRITSRTPLTFYNFSDPFLPQNTKELTRILNELDQRQFTNPIGIITRTFADSRTLDEIGALKNVRVVVLVSYAGYENRIIESAPAERRITLMKELKSRKIPVLQYLRPLVKEWLEKDQLHKVIDKVAGNIDGVVMSGIRLTPEIENKIHSRGLPVPYVPNNSNKYFPKEIQEEVLRVFSGIAPVYRYTSCGVSATLGIPDYNAHLGFFRETQAMQYQKCPLPCSEKQYETCKSHRVPNIATVRGLLDKISLEKVSFEISTSGGISLDTEVSKYDLSFIRQNTSCHVDYNGNKHHIDQIANIDVRSDR